MYAIVITLTLMVKRPLIMSSTLDSSEIARWWIREYNTVPSLHISADYGEQLTALLCY